MDVSSKVEKVTGFVTRQLAEVPELLVIRHPTMGLQVPAGTVELGESPDLAVIRETHEESGITDLRLIKELGSQVRTLPDDEGVILRMTKLFDAPAYDASSEGYGLTRGLPVRVLALYGKFAEVETEVLDMSQQPPSRKPGVSGYVRRSLIGRKIKRYFYHLTTETATDETWTIQVDGHLFKLLWMPLIPKPELSPWQTEWLERYYSLLLTAD